MAASKVDKLNSSDYANWSADIKYVLLDIIDEAKQTPENALL